MSKRNHPDTTNQAQPITSVEVARLAGVSQSTVSRVFSARAGVGVSSETMRRVRATAQRLIERPDRPDAIFCANDITALDAIDAARQAAINIPEQLSIIGFDDIPAASWGAYALTTVQQPVNTMIDLSVRALLERIETPELPPSTTFVPGRLVRRGSARLA